MQIVAIRIPWRLQPPRARPSAIELSRQNQDQILDVRYMVAKPTQETAPLENCSSSRRVYPAAATPRLGQEGWLVASASRLKKTDGIRPHDPQAGAECSSRGILPRADTRCSTGQGLAHPPPTPPPPPPPNKGPRNLGSHLPARRQEKSFSRPISQLSAIPFPVARGLGLLWARDCKQVTSPV